MDKFAKVRTHAFGIVDDTDNRIRELESAVRVLAMGLAQSSAGPMVEDVLLHVADSLQEIRGQLDEAATAVLQAMKRAAA